MPITRRHLPLLVLLLAAAALAGGAGAAGAARSAAPQWPYQVYRPASLSKAQQVPLVVVPSDGTNYMVTTTRFNQAADKYGFVVVYPQVMKSYNDVAHAQGESVSNPYPDMVYLSNVIDAVTASENINPNRVYMTGFSRSATLSYRAGCVLASKLAGIAPVAGVVVDPKCVPSRP